MLTSQWAPNIPLNTIAAALNCITHKFTLSLRVDSHYHHFIGILPMNQQYESSGGMFISSRPSVVCNIKHISPIAISTTLSNWSCRHCRACAVCVIGSAFVAFISSNQKLRRSSESCTSRLFVWLHKGCRAGMKLGLQIKESWCGIMDLSCESLKKLLGTHLSEPKQLLQMVSTCVYSILHWTWSTMWLATWSLSLSAAPWLPKCSWFVGFHSSTEEMNTSPNVLNAGREKPPRTSTRLRGMPSKNGRISHQPDVSEAAETQLLNSWSVGRGRSSHRTPEMAVFSFPWIYLAAKMWGSKYLLNPRGYFSHQLTHLHQWNPSEDTHTLTDVLS